MMCPEDFNENRKRLELSIAGIIFVIALTYLIFSLFLPKLGFYPLEDGPLLIVYIGIFLISLIFGILFFGILSKTKNGSKKLYRY